MKFDPSVNLGHVLTILAMILGGLAAYTSIQVDLAELKTIVNGYQVDLNDHEDRIRKLEAIISTVNR
ncbi:MAG: hypothetical protein AAF198_06300 [Pseudomonadota bacterium]